MKEITLLGRCLGNADLNNPCSCQVKSLFSPSKKPERFLLVWHETALLPFHKNIEIWARKGLRRLHQPSMDLAHLFPKKVPLADIPPACSTSSPFTTTLFSSSSKQAIRQTSKPSAPAPTICEATVDRQNNLLVFTLQAAPEDIKARAKILQTKTQFVPFLFSAMCSRAWDALGSLQNFLHTVPVFVEVPCPESDTKHCCWTVLNTMMYWTGMQDFLH